MNRRIPPDAFSFYYSLGPTRTYQMVAEEYGVSKQAVAKLAAKDGWQECVRDIDRKAAKRAEDQLVETVEQMNIRHLKMLKLIQGRALEALKTMPLGTAMDAVRSLDLAMRQERLVRGESTDRSELSIEEVTRQEIQTLLRVVEEDGTGDAAAG